MLSSLLPVITAFCSFLRWLARDRLFSSSSTLVRCRSAAPLRSVDPSSSSSDGPLQCQQLVLTSNPSARVLLDPSSYGYQGCSCKAPFRAEAEVQGGVTVSLRCVLGSQVRRQRGDGWVLPDSELRDPLIPMP